MSFKSLLSDYRIRILLGVVIGVLSKFASDIIFSLLYRFYPLFQPVGGYIVLIITTLFLVELFYRIEKNLDVNYKWTSQNQQRFWIQLTLQILATVIISVIVRAVFLFIIFKQPVIVLLDEIIILIGGVLICVTYNMVNYWLMVLYRWRFSLAEIERFKKENAESRFETLRNQVNPHFLFNSLNTLSSIMYENVDTAAQYIRRLSDVYRYVLENRHKDLISLSKELQFIDAYKYLFELRFTDRLTLEVVVEENTMDLFIAPMTLQMLVENAVKHNVISSKNPLHIKIYCDNDYLIVTNNLQQKPPEGYSSGMGLNNIISQYDFLSTKKVEVLKTDSEFQVRIPLLTSKEITKND